MKLTVFGALVFGAGTWLTFFDRWRILGVVLLVLSTLIIAVAQRRDSKSDAVEIQATMERKLTEFQRDLASAKALPSPTESAKKLDQIDNAFHDWAAGFVRNKERRKLEVKQARAADLETQLDKSELWRPVLEVFLGAVGEAARAYSKASGTTISANLPKLPPNLYDKSSRYDARIVFRKDVSWLIQLDRQMDFLGEFPGMVVTLVRSDDKDLLARLWSIDRKDGFVKFTVETEHIAPLSGMSGKFSKANYRTELPKAVMRFFEAQILALEGHAD
jgi:hypothetical protein